MIRVSRSCTTLKFGVGSLMPGRVVKTLKYTRAILNKFIDLKLPQSDVEDWCNTVFRVLSLSNCKQIVKLEYTITGRSNSTYTVEWPVEALDSTFGIKIS